MSGARVRFHSAARAEAEAAIRWYEERSQGLGGDFLQEIERAVLVISESPGAWPVTVRISSCTIVSLRPRDHFTQTTE